MVAHRTKDKNGYVALQLGSGVRKAQRTTKADRGHFAVAKVEPKRKLAEFRVDDDARHSGRRRDHRRSFRRRSICRCHRHLDRQGLGRRHEALEFRAACAPRHGVSISHRSIGSTGGRQDPGKTFKNKKMSGHMGVDRVTTLNLKVVQTDVERGLILVEGAVPGVKGGWITVRDAVKKKLPKGVPKPGKFKLADNAARGACRRAGWPASGEGA